MWVALFVLDVKRSEYNDEVFRISVFNNSGIRSSPIIYYLDMICVRM